MSNYQSGPAIDNSGATSTISNGCLELASNCRITSGKGDASSTSTRSHLYRRKTRAFRSSAARSALPYVVRSSKGNYRHFATGNHSGRMDGSHSLVHTVSPPKEPVSPFTEREMLTVPTAKPPDVSHMNPTSSFHSNAVLREESPQRNQQQQEGQITTVVVDGQTYYVHDLLSVVTRLKHEVRTYTERISRLEHELQQARVILSARDRDIHKLRSVLDQKIPTASNYICALDTVDEADTNNVDCKTFDNKTSLHHIEAQRVKKQGVSGESQTPQRTFGLIHHSKDTGSSQLIREAIRSNDFLRHLDNAQVEEIVQCMYKKDVAQGAYIIREGQTGDALYVVADGVLEVSKDEKLLGRMDVGRAFGELALLYNCKRTASVKALTKASIWTLDRRVFQQIMMSSYINQHEENFRFLQSVPAFKSLSATKMHKLADVLEEVCYGPNEYIIREGEIGETFFIIKTGRVLVTKSLGDSETTQEIRQLHEGEWFGEKALYTSEKRSANVIALGPGVHLLSLDRSNFIHLIGDLNEIRSKDYGDSIGLSQTRTLSGGLPKAVEETDIDAAPVIPDFASQIEREDLNRVAVLGIGGFGCVDLVVWNKDMTKSFALKRMKKQHIVQTRQQEHICSERKIMLELRSPFICRLYRTYRDNKFVYLLMEACLGGELWTLLRNRGHFTDTVARFVVACVLEAFTYLHTRGIIYRDLKPENLLLDAKGYIKLCDFGFAKRIGIGKKTWTFCGTPEYVAPEIILNKGHDYSADYWSLGILIFELLTGSPPFTGSDPMKIYNVVLRGIETVEFPASQITRTATALIKRLCTQNPAHRLGYGLGGVIDIKQNKYFQGFDWIGLHRGTLTAPIQPAICGPCDTSNFDKYPDRMDNAPDELSGWDADF